MPQTPYTIYSFPFQDYLPTGLTFYVPVSVHQKFMTLGEGPDF